MKRKEREGRLNKNGNGKKTTREGGKKEVDKAEREAWRKERRGKRGEGGKGEGKSGGNQGNAVEEELIS